MKLENQVCSLKLARKLKKLGVKQESLYFWGRLYGKIHGNTKYIDRLFFLKRKEDITYKHADIVSAYTCAELGKILNNRGLYIGSDIISDLDKGTEGVIVNCTPPEHKLGKSFEADTEANARAKMLVWDKEKNGDENENSR